MKEDAKAMQKYEQAVQAASARLGQYRMPFAWAAWPLFDKSSELDTNGGADVTLRPLFRQGSEKLKVCVRTRRQPLVSRR